MSTTGFQRQGRLIGLGGKLRAGKDAIGDYLEQNKNFVKLGMSDALNSALQQIGPEGPWVRLDFSIIIEKPWEVGTWKGRFMKGDYVRYAQLVAMVGYVEAKRHKDVREYLQGLGTEVGREMIDENVWVRIAEKKIRDHWTAGQDVVITAIRFPNELEMIKRLGGLSVWVDRPDAERLSEDSESVERVQSADKGLQAVTEAYRAVQQHASENSVSAEDFLILVKNDGTLDDLYAKTDEILEVQVSRAGSGYDYRIGSHWMHPAQEDTELEFYPPYDR